MTFHREGNFYISIEETQVLLIASTFDASIKTDSKIIERLKEISFSGDVLVDMLLRNGNSSTRLLSIFFDGQKFKTNKAKIIKDKNILLTFEDNFYKKHPQLIENSILSREEKQELLHS